MILQVVDDRADKAWLQDCSMEVCLQSFSQIAVLVMLRCHLQQLVTFRVSAEFSLLSVGTTPLKQQVWCACFVMVLVGIAGPI